MASAVAVPGSRAATSPRSVCDSHYAAHKKRVVEVELGTRTPKGDYCLIYELGKGGNGVVYLGQSIVDSTRFRAVKVTKNVARNMKEYTAMTNFDHPNVVKVDDLQITEDGSLMMIIMEVKSKLLRALWFGSSVLRFVLRRWPLVAEKTSQPSASTTKRPRNRPRAHRNQGMHKVACHSFPTPRAHTHTHTHAFPPVSLSPAARQSLHSSPPPSLPRLPSLSAAASSSTTLRDPRAAR